MSICYYHIVNRINQNKEVQTMNNSDYLTETEKFLLGYIEHIPSEYPPYEDEWNEDEVTELETLNEIFNL